MEKEEDSGRRERMAGEQTMIKVGEGDIKRGRRGKQGERKKWEGEGLEG